MAPVNSSDSTLGRRTRTPVEGSLSSANCDRLQRHRPCVVRNFLGSEHAIVIRPRAHWPLPRRDVVWSRSCVAQTRLTALPTAKRPRQVELQLSKTDGTSSQQTCVAPWLQDSWIRTRVASLIHRIGIRLGYYRVVNPDKDRWVAPELSDRTPLSGSRFQHCTSPGNRLPIPSHCLLPLCTMNSRPIHSYPDMCQGSLLPAVCTRRT